MPKTRFTYIAHALSVFALSSMLAACGGSDGSSSGSNPSATQAAAVSTTTGSSTNGSTPTGTTGSTTGSTTGNTTGNTSGSTIDLSCDQATFPSTLWTQCEVQNYAKILQAPTEEVSNPVFLQRLVLQSAANAASLLARDVADPSWVLASPNGLTQLVSGLSNPATSAAQLQALLTQLSKNPANAVSISLNTPLTPLCTSWVGPCAGDPFRYPGNDSFYTSEAIVTPVVFYDSDCARLSGRVWRPKQIASGQKLPSVIIDNGSVEAPETLYWWAAQLLVRNGYTVLTYDPRGQGRSDMESPTGKQGGNIDSSVFRTGLVDAIDFFRSSAAHPYPNNITCAASYPTVTTPYNPIVAVTDPDRLGIAGHSAGAEGVSVIQGYGGVGADPWPGKLDSSNPVKVAIAWDGLVAPDGKGMGGANGNLPSLPSLPSTSTAVAPKFTARVPSMDQASEYGLAPVPFTQTPDPETHKHAFQAWQSAGTPVFALTIQGSTHYEWSQIPTFPATSWCPQVVNNRCVGGWGNPMAQHYTLAWFDRWLKKAGEVGYDDADARLLDDNGDNGRIKMSFRYHSARDFPDRTGVRQHCENIRSGC